MHPALLLKSQAPATSAGLAIWAPYWLPLAGAVGGRWLDVADPDVGITNE
jgi:hypothetical protein